MGRRTKLLLDFLLATFREPVAKVVVYEEDHKVKAEHQYVVRHKHEADCGCYIHHFYWIIRKIFHVSNDHNFSGVINDPFERLKTFFPNFRVAVNADANDRCVVDTKEKPDDNVEDHDFAIGLDAKLLE